MTDTTENKKIPTFTQLMDRAMRLYAKDPAEYEKAFDAGTDQLIRGAKVKMVRGRIDYTPFAFDVYTPQDGTVQYRERYFRVLGLYWKGERYSLYDIEASATKYRKRIHKFLPVTLPEGMKSSSNCYAVPATYHNADGTVAKVGRWLNGRRGYSGYAEHIVRMMIQDSTGKFLLFGDKEFEQYSQLQHSGHYDQNAGIRHGFFPCSSHSKIAWYDSMKCPEDLPNCWDQDRVRLMAAKVHSEFLNFAKQYPHCKIVMYPMHRKQPAEGNMRGADPFVGGSYMSNRRAHVLHRRPDGKQDRFYMPEICLYWDDLARKSDESLGGGPLQFIHVVIPPYGCELLKAGKYSSLSEVYSHGPGSHGYNRAVQGDIPLESVFYTLRGKKPGATTDFNVRDGQCYGAVELGKNQNDKFLVNLYEKRNVVLVSDHTDPENFTARFGAYAMTPDSILARVKERELIDSLPLC